VSDETSHHQCRACGSSALTAIAFPSHTNDDRLRFLRRSKAPAETETPTELFLCDPSQDVRACGLLQTTPSDESIAQSALPALPSMERVARSAATQALEMLSGRDCRALDISNVAKPRESVYPSWVETHRAKTTAFTESFLDTGLFDIVTILSGFDQTRNPAATLDRIKTILADDGIVVMDLAYAPIILTSNSLIPLRQDTHALFSLFTLEQLVKCYGMRIVRGSILNRDSGTLRVFLTHDYCNEYDFDPWSERLAKMWDEETALGLRDQAPYQSYLIRVQTIKQDLKDLLSEMVDQDDSIAVVVGTCASAEQLVSLTGGATGMISAALPWSEKRPLPGRFPVPIVQRDRLPDLQSVVLVVPAHLKRDALDLFQGEILRGARIICATPAPHVIHAGNYSAEYGKCLFADRDGGDVETLHSILSASGRPRLVTADGMRTTG